MEENGAVVNRSVLSFIDYRISKCQYPGKRKKNSTRAKVIDKVEKVI